ncbi:hypothetical protein CBL_08909 [Carabus blaptoides fortunei]
MLLLDLDALSTLRIDLGASLRLSVRMLTKRHGNLPKKKEPKEKHTKNVLLNNLSSPLCHRTNKHEGNACLIIPGAITARQAASATSSHCCSPDSSRSILDMRKLISVGHLARGGQWEGARETKSSNARLQISCYPAAINGSPREMAVTTLLPNSSPSVSSLPSGGGEISNLFSTSWRRNQFPFSKTSPQRKIECDLPNVLSILKLANFVFVLPLTWFALTPCTMQMQTFLDEIAEITFPH